MTKQCKFTPHNQNESKVERRIQDAKHKTTLVLQRSMTPLIFWCYALIFVVDCLNHTAKKPLGWRISTEVLNGDSSDISQFRFRFWQPIKFMDKENFPESRWKMGREFVRNVVCARDESEILVDQEEKPDLTRFKFQRMKRNQIYYF